MSKASKKAALEELTEARKKLDQTSTPKGATQEQVTAANDAVLDAEKKVRFGTQRGWKY